MPNHFAAVSLIDRGERLASFVGETFPLRASEARVEGHLQAMRERGAHYPGKLPAPEREQAVAEVEDLPSESGAREVAREAAGPRRPAPPRAVVPRAAGKRKDSDANGQAADRDHVEGAGAPADISVEPSKQSRFSHGA